MLEMYQSTVQNNLGHSKSATMKDSSCRRNLIKAANHSECPAPRSRLRRYFNRPPVDVLIAAESDLKAPFSVMPSTEEIREFFVNIFNWLLLMRQTVLAAVLGRIRRQPRYLNYSSMFGKTFRPVLVDVLDLKRASSIETMVDCKFESMVGICKTTETAYKTNRNSRNQKSRVNRHSEFTGKSQPAETRGLWSFWGKALTGQNRTIRSFGHGLMATPLQLADGANETINSKDFDKRSLV